MATTRFAFPAVTWDAQPFQHFCPNCHRQMVRDGRQGARNRPFSCRVDCQFRFRKTSSFIALTRALVLDSFDSPYAYETDQVTGLKI